MRTDTPERESSDIGHLVASFMADNPGMVQKSMAPIKGEIFGLCRFTAISLGKAIPFDRNPEIYMENICKAMHLCSKDNEGRGDCFYYSLQDCLRGINHPWKHESIQRMRWRICDALAKKFNSFSPEQRHDFLIFCFANSERGASFDINTICEGAGTEGVKYLRHGQQNLFDEYNKLHLMNGKYATQIQFFVAPQVYNVIIQVIAEDKLCQIFRPIHPSVPTPTVTIYNLLAHFIALMPLKTPFHWRGQGYKSDTSDSPDSSSSSKETAPEQHTWTQKAEAGERKGDRGDASPPAFEDALRALQSCCDALCKSRSRDQETQELLSLAMQSFHEVRALL
jgi:hypothetical protein